MKQPRPPAPLKRGDEWSRSEIRRYLKWCNQPENRTNILLTIMQKLSWRGYRCSPEQIEEIWSDFCLQLRLRLQGYDPRKGRSAHDYLIAGCVQSAIDVDRVERRRRDIRRAMSPSDVARFSTLVRSRDVESDLVAHLDAQRLKRLIEDELSSTDQAVLKAYYLKEQTLKEIAREFEITRDAAKMRLYRARGRLIEILVKHEIFQEVPRSAR